MQRAQPPIASVVKVFDCLEFLHFQGLALSLVFLPDYLDEIEMTEVDYAEWEKLGPDKRLVKRWRRRMLGGHAGIGALTLGHLRDANDGTFQIAYLFKAGQDHAGRARNIRDILADRGRAPIEYVRGFPGGEDRSLLSRMEIAKRVVDPMGTSDLTLQELADDKEAITAIRRADGLLSTVEASTLVELGKAGSLTAAAGTVIDCPFYEDDIRANEVHLRRLRSAKGWIGFLSMSEDESLGYARLVSGKSSLGNGFSGDSSYSAARYLFEDLGTPILLHAATFSTIVDGQVRSIVPAFRLRERKSVNGAGDTFNSAFLLAQTVRSRASRHRIPPERIPDIGDCLVFAAAVAAARIETGDYVTDQEVLTTTAKLSVVEPGALESYGFASAQLTLARALTRGCSVQSQVRWDDFDSLAGIVRDPAQPRWQRCAALLCGLDGEPSFRDIVARGSCGDLHPIPSVRGLRKLARIRRVVFVDLDHTLFATRECRERAALRALRAMGFRDGDRRLRQVFDLTYREHATYAAMEHIRVDFRYTWNTNEQYRLIYALFHHGKDSMQLTPSLYEDKLGTDDFLLNVEAYYQSLVHDTRVTELCRKAVEDFDSTPFSPYPDTRQFLATLGNALSCELCVVTEGYFDTQKDKLRKLGLLGFFKETHILVSEASENPQKVRDELEFAAVRGSDEDHERAGQLLALFEQVTAQRKKLFHSMAIRAVLQSPENPLEAFQELQKSSLSTEPARSDVHAAKLAVVGDRYDTDYLPYRQLDPDAKRIVTLRVVRGDYSDKDRPEVPPPGYREVPNLYVALEHLVRDDTWHAVEETPMPHLEPTRLTDADIELLDDCENSRDRFVLHYSRMVRGMARS